MKTITNTMRKGFTTLALINTLLAGGASTYAVVKASTQILEVVRNSTVDKMVVVAKAVQTDLLNYEMRDGEILNNSIEDDAYEIRTKFQDDLTISYENQVCELGNVGQIITVSYNCEKVSPVNSLLLTLSAVNQMNENEGLAEGDANLYTPENTEVDSYSECKAQFNKYIEYDTCTNTSEVFTGVNYAY